MKALYLDPLISRGESTEAMLHRLFNNIGTLTGLIDDAERTSHWYLAKILSGSRDILVAEAQATIASAREKNASVVEGERPSVEIDFVPAQALLLMDTAAVGPERRFLLIGNALAGSDMALFPPHRPRREATRFALLDGASPSLSAHSYLSNQQIA